MEQLALTALSVLLAVAYDGGLTPGSVAGTLLAICCAGLTQWLLLSRTAWAWVPSLFLGLAALAFPPLFVALPAAGYAGARTFRCMPCPSAFPSSRIPSLAYQAFSWCMALPWIPAVIRLIAQSMCSTPPISESHPCGMAMLCAMGMLCAVAGMLGYARLGLSRRSRALRHAHDEHRAMMRELTSRLSCSAEERGVAVRMATLNERTRIARDIHDNVGHLLTRAIMQTEASKVVARMRDDETTVRSLEGIGTTLHEAMTVMRRSVHDLADDGTDFAAMIEAAAQSSPSLRVRVTNGVEDAPAPVARCCSALIREALANAVHHGTATHAEVTLRDFPAFWQIVVQDDGGNHADTESAGAPRQDPESGRGMGLADIEDRVHALDGTCTYGPYGNGWRVFASIPKAGFGAARTS